MAKAARCSGFRRGVAHDANDRTRAAAFERLEVRAFGYLLGELLERCEPRTWAGRDAIDALAVACLNEAIDARPSFGEIAAELATRADGRASLTPAAQSAV